MTRSSLHTFKLATLAAAIAMTALPAAAQQYTLILPSPGVASDPLRNLGVNLADVSLPSGLPGQPYSADLRGALQITDDLPGVAQRRHKRDQWIATTPNMGEVRLHLFAWGRLEPYHWLRFRMMLSSQKVLKLSQATVIATLLNLSQQHNAWDSVGSGRFNTPQ